MAVTTSYTWQSRTSGVANFLTGNAEVGATNAGGFTFWGDHAGHTDGQIFSAAGAQIGSATSITGLNASTAGLSNGNVVVASQDGDSILYTIRNATGGQVLATVDIGDTGSTNADVTALFGGGFAIANQDAFTAPDNDIDIRVYDSAGAETAAWAVDFSGADDRDASIARLDNGNIAVAWTRTIGAETEVWTAVYTPAGAVVQAPTLLDSTGTINRNVSVAAVSGGFSVAYEDNGWATGTVDITLATLTSTGAFVRWIAVNDPDFSGDSSEDANPALARLSNGMLSVSWDNNSFTDSDTYVALTDAAGANVLTTSNIMLGQSIFDDQQGGSLAGFGLGRLALTVDNLTDGTVDYGSLSATRMLTGDAASDVINAFSDMDHILAGQDGNDTLNGNNGFDTLDGGNGKDKLFGNFGDDSLYGGNGKDRLEGGNGNDVLYGGAGGDRMTGGAGANDFRFDTLTVSADKDRVTDFVHAVDKLSFENGVFTAFSGYTSGATLLGSDLKQGTAATNADHNIIYDRPTGRLWYDSDGVGGAAQVLIAVLDTSPQITASDIVVL